MDRWFILVESSQMRPGCELIFFHSIICEFRWSSASSSFGVRFSSVSWLFHLKSRECHIEQMSASFWCQSRLRCDNYLISSTISRSDAISIAVMNTSCKRAAKGAESFLPSGKAACRWKLNEVHAALIAVYLFLVLQVIVYQLCQLTSVLVSLLTSPWLTLLTCWMF